MPGGSTWGPTTTEEWVKTVDKRVTNLERRSNAGGAGGSGGNSGSTAQRDARYGAPPTTDPERVTLANSKPVWFNTDLGWEEGYFATSGLQGLIVPGLIPGVTSGWYPLGPGGPRMYLVAGTQQAMASGNTYTNWAAPGTGRSWRRGGTAYFTYATGVVTTVRAGRYRCTLMQTMQAGSGTGTLYLIKNNSNSDPNVVAQAAPILNSSWEIPFTLSQPDILLLANENLRVYAANMGGAIMAPAADGTKERLGTWGMEYIGPALVNN